MPWHVKNEGGYAVDTPMWRYPTSEGWDNIKQVYYILRGKGWTTQAIVGMVTCAGFECKYNPWLWEGTQPGGYALFPTQDAANHDDGSHNGYYGYGWVQWTPASYANVYRPHLNKYQCNPNAINIPGYGPNFRDEPGSVYDGYAQIIFLDAYGGDGQYYMYESYYGRLCPTYDSYKISTAAASDLCETWTQNFERGSGSWDPNQRAHRQQLANYLYSVLQNEPVLPPDTPGGGSVPAWLLMKWRQDNMRRR